MYSCNNNDNNRLPTVLVKERKKDRQREWKEKMLHGQFLRETEEHANRSRWEWLKRGELKRGTESLICAAQGQALRTNSVVHSIDKTNTTPLCRLCKEKTESVNHIISACPNLAKNQYRKRHDKLGKKIHWLMCKKFLIDCNEKWFLHEPEPVQENERCKLLWEFTIQTDKLLEHRRPDIVVIDKEKKECILIDLAVPGDQNITAKELEKITKYQDLLIEIEKLWDVKGPQSSCSADSGRCTGNSIQRAGETSKTNRHSSGRPMLAEGCLARYSLHRVELRYQV